MKYHFKKWFTHFLSGLSATELVLALGLSTTSGKATLGLFFIDIILVVSAIVNLQLVERYGK